MSTVFIYILHSLHISPNYKRVLVKHRAYLRQGLEEVGLVSERIVDEAVAERDDAMGEVVLR